MTARDRQILDIREQEIGRLLRMDPDAGKGAGVARLLFLHRWCRDAETGDERDAAIRAAGL